MSYEERYDTMCDYDAEQMNEGRAEVIEELITYFKKNERTWTSKQMIYFLEEW